MRYCGSSRLNPRRGTARTSPAWLRRFGHPAAPITLDVGDGPWAGVACWGGEQLWVQVHVRVAYKLFYDQLRADLPWGVSVAAVVAVAQEMAIAADWSTGRNSRLSNETISERTGRSVRTVQRARTLLRLLGLATEVLRGRQRTRRERLASWRVGDRARGWASVYALHGRRASASESQHITRVIEDVSPHPRRGLFSSSISRQSVVTTEATAHNRGATRRREQKRRLTLRRNHLQGAVLASRWHRDSSTPAWVRRASVTAWAPVCEILAAHGWTVEDINTLTGVRTEPSSPVAYMRWVLTRTDLDFPPHIEWEAERAMVRREADARIAQQLRERDEQARRRAAGATAGAAAREEIRRNLADLARRRVDRKGRR